jgi:chromosome segregation ATPase
MDTKNLKADWDEMVAKLERERDELRLKMNLGRKDLQAEWERLEAQWRELKSVKGPALKDALSQVADDLKKGYANIRKLL